MTKLSTYSMSAAVSLTMFMGALYIYETAVRQPSINLIYAPAGEARPMPIEMMRLPPTAG